MSTDLLQRYSDIIIGASEHELRSDPSLGGRLVLTSEGEITISYAPFDYITSNAKIAIVGITPGAQQATNALIKARQQMIAGESIETALKSAKVYASFSGPMRANLVSMLDYIGLNRWVGVATCANLWDESAELVHFTSALRYPVFVGRKNYSGAPSMSRNPVLRDLVTNYLAEEAAMLPEAVWVPLGPRAQEGLNVLITTKVLSENRVLSGLPHPSGANAERIAYFLGRKQRNALSAKTSAETIDRARERLFEQVSQLPQ